jgi:hypothetical protein
MVINTGKPKKLGKKLLPFHFLHHKSFITSLNNYMNPKTEKGLRRDNWVNEAGTGQVVTQLHARR